MSTFGIRELLVVGVVILVVVGLAFAVRLLGGRRGGGS